MTMIDKIMMLDDAEDFGFIDVGARGGITPRAHPYREILKVVLVEPDQEEAKRLHESLAHTYSCSVISSALGNFDGPIDLYVTNNPTCVSALKANLEFLGRYGIDIHFHTKEITRVNCSRFDTLFSLGGLPIPRAIKIDVQGFEYQVLEGFGKHLHDCLALEIETHFYPIYQDQRTFEEMVRFLSSYNFVLRSLSNPRSPCLRGDKHFDGDLVEVDARFSKSNRWLSQQTEKIIDKFRIACSVIDIDLYSNLILD